MTEDVGPVATRTAGRRLPRPNVAFLAMAVGRRVRTQVDADLSDIGLTYRHLSALGHLARDPDLSYAELARRGGVTTQSMQATLAQLRQLGAVEQLNPARRGLRAQLRVTQTGAAMLEQGMRAIEEVEHHLLAALPEPQRDLLGPILLTLFTTLTDQPPA